MALVPSHRRNRGKLALLVSLIVTLLQASTAAVKMAPKRVRGGNGRRSLTGMTASDEYELVIEAAYSPGGYDEDMNEYSGKGKGGKGKGGGTKVAECYDACTETPFGDSESQSPTVSQSPTAAPTRSPIEKSEKPGCCKGGVSSLKMIYQGPVDGTLFLSSYEGLDTLDLVDPCGETRRLMSGSRSSTSSAIVKFVSCSQCFPDGSTTASPACDFSSESADVVPGDEVCLAAFDSSGALSLTSKFPTDLDLYFSAAGSKEVTQTTLHTSCSKPIHRPYAISLDYCESSGYPFYLDLDMIDMDSVDDHPILVFIDGTSRNFPGELFTNCGSSATATPDDDQCCKGGASFLKVRVGGTTTDGVLTANATLASDCAYIDDASSTSHSGSQSHGGNKSSSVRFVSCDDECLDDPYSVVECSDPSDSAPAIPGEDICFGSWNESANRFDFGSKMPTNLELFFLPEDMDSFPVQSAYIHTSCSKPLYPNWAQVFAEDCTSSDGELVNLDDVETGDLDSSFHLAFIDGVSRKYFEEAKDLFNSNGISFFDINFADCGCNCFETAFTSAPPSPSAGPSPSSVPTVATLPAPGPPSGPEGSCEDQCVDWVSQFCVFTDEEGSAIPGAPCVVSGVDEAPEVEEGSGDDGARRLFHERMIQMYDDLLKGL